MSNRLIDDTADEAETPPPTPPLIAASRPSATRTPRKMGGNGAYPGRRQITAYIEKPLFMRIKAISAQTERPMVEILEEALTTFVSSYLSQRKFRDM